MLLGMVSYLLLFGSLFLFHRLPGRLGLVWGEIDMFIPPRNRILVLILDTEGTVAEAASMPGPVGVRFTKCFFIHV